MARRTQARARYTVDELCEVYLNEDAHIALLKGGENLYEAIRRPAYVQYKKIRANEAGAVAGADSRHLHDLRVAIRRFRALLKWYRKPLRNTWAEDLDRRLATVADALGPARDYDVWMERLSALEKEQDLTRSRVWKRYKAYQLEFTEQHAANVRQVVGGARYRNLMQEMAYFLRVQLPEAIEENRKRLVEPYVAERLWRLARRIYTSEIPGGAWEVEDYHAFRKQCRRARYVAEFYGGIIGPRTRRWAKTFKRMADAVGDLHDGDVGLERVAYEPVPAPRVLVSALKARRTEALRDVDAVWNDMKDKTAFRELKRELKRHFD